MSQTLYYVFKGMDLPRYLIQTLSESPVVPGRTSAEFALYEQDTSNVKVVVQLKEDFDCNAPLKSRFSLTYVSPFNNSSDSHILPGLSLQTIRDDLRNSLCKYVSTDCSAYFGQEALPFYERYLTIHDVQSLASEMAVELDCSKERMQFYEGIPHFLAKDSTTELVTTGRESWMANTVRVKLVSYPGPEQDTPIAFIQVDCDIVPKFSDFRRIDAGQPAVEAIERILNDVLAQVSQALELKSNEKTDESTSFFRLADPLQPMERVRVDSKSLKHYTTRYSLLYAYVLQSLMGYDMWAIYDLKDPNSIYDPWNIHTFCRKGDYLFDGRGATKDAKKFFAPWAACIASGCKVMKITAEAAESVIRLSNPSSLEQARAVAAYIRANYRAYAASNSGEEKVNAETGVSLFFHEGDPIAAMMKVSMGTENVAQLALTRSVAFALQLHKMTGYTMECLCEPADPDMPFDPWYARVIHAYCREGKTFIDARGRTTDREQFFLPWAGMILDGSETIMLTDDTAMESLRCGDTDRRIAEQLDEAKPYILNNYREFIVY